jgi:eukaryotic-like serine/threonine-protein kinase
VIADLGIARAAYEDSLTASGELLGTASYISPEQAMGHAATPASDRYALAVIAYQLLTGARPFGGTSLAEQAMQHIESEPAPPSARVPALPAAVDEVMGRGLAKEPGERPEAAGELVDALDEALQAAPEPHRPSSIEPEPTVPLTPVMARAPRPGRRPVAAIAALIVAAALLGTVVALSNSGGGGSSPAKQGSVAARPHAKKHRQAPPASRPTTPAAPIPAGATPASLNQEGFALMNAGRYDQAIPLLKDAIAAAPKGSGDLTYAYALYNLGRSLRLAGKPAEAIPYLQRRLGIANQRDVVRRELAAARAQAASG